MLFDFLSFVEELKENPEKKEIVEKYEKFYGPIETDIPEQIRYKEYVNTFPFIQYKVPEELKNDFDWELLMKLVGSSLSSEWSFDNQAEGELPDFVISVQSGDQVVVKKISELWGFQILRLYEIYIEEQMNLQILMAEDEKEKEAIVSQREYKFNRWKLVMDNLERETLQKEETKEKDEKLTNLMDQL